MKNHTTNYYSTLILPSEDCPVAQSEIPPVKKLPTVANRQFEMMASRAYRFSSDDVLFTVFADKADIPEQERSAARADFFSKGQACLRASPLAKRYGWAVHSDAHGKVALVDTASERFLELQADDSLKKIRAMRSSRA